MPRAIPMLYHLDLTWMWDRTCMTISPRQGHWPKTCSFTNRQPSVICPLRNFIVVCFTDTWPLWLVSHNFTSEWYIENSSHYSSKTDLEVCLLTLLDDHLPSQSMQLCGGVQTAVLDRGGLDHLGSFHGLFLHHRVGRQFGDEYSVVLGTTLNWAYGKSHFKAFQW